MMLLPEQEQKLAWAKEQLETGMLTGDSSDINRRLKEAGLDVETRKAFGRWFIQKGLDEGWLITELGFDY